MGSLRRGINQRKKGGERLYTQNEHIKGKKKWEMNKDRREKREGGTEEMIEELCDNI